MTTIPEVTLDCVELKRRVQAEVYEETKELTPDELVRYFQESAAAGPLGAWWRTARARDAAREAGRAAARSA